MIIQCRLCHIVYGINIQDFKADHNKNFILFSMSKLLV